MVPLDLDPKPLVVAEEMNTTTRVEHFKNMVRAQDYDGILTLAKKLVNEGSHMLDLCCAIVGEDEKAYISNILEKIATRVPAPITIDSTEADVIEEALKRIPARRSSIRSIWRTARSVRPKFCRWRNATARR